MKELKLIITPTSFELTISEDRLNIKYLFE